MNGSIDVDLPCTACGYNLRGLPATNRCPECGLPVRETLLTHGGYDGSGRPVIAALYDPIAAEIGCSVDALMFTLDCVALATRKAWPHGSPKGIHVTARDVCNAVREHASSYFNDRDEALSLLDEWGIRRSEDVGAMVFGLVAHGFLKVSPNDRREDFAGLFTLATLFEDGAPDDRR